jgi:hypothetical protein
MARWQGQIHVPDLDDLGGLRGSRVRLRDVHGVMRGRGMQTGTDKQLTWFVTFEVPKTRTKMRRSRATRAFCSEAQAKDFAREKLDKGLVVSAGTMVPYSPRQIIPSASVPAWLGPVEPKSIDDQGSDDAR